MPIKYKFEEVYNSNHNAFVTQAIKTSIKGRAGQDFPDVDDWSRLDYVLHNFFTNSKKASKKTEEEKTYERVYKRRERRIEQVGDTSIEWTECNC